MVLKEIRVGDVVRFRRGDAWLIGTVVREGRSTYHIEVGDDFTGRRTFAEQKAILRSNQPEGPVDLPTGEIEVDEGVANGDE